MDQNGQNTQTYVTEVPSTLKQLVRLVSRGFYQLEDSLLLDMLVRNPCMKEADVCGLLRFDPKVMRARIATLKADKIIQTRLKVETGPDGKATKVNYYYINYKSFVNVVKYKLDHMRKKMETEERDATRRASFKCSQCEKTFTDLQIDQLMVINPLSEEELLRCTHCHGLVEEDESAVSRQNGRMRLAAYNQQMEPLWNLLQQVEDIRLDPSILEPEPTDMSAISRALDKTKGIKRDESKAWSGDATAKNSFGEESRIDLRIGEDALSQKRDGPKKELPIWLAESTVRTEESIAVETLVASSNDMAGADTSVRSADIMSVLLQHEKKGEGAPGAVAAVASDSARALRELSDEDYSMSGVDEDSRMSFGFSAQVPTSILLGEAVEGDDIDEIGVMESGDEDDDVPMVLVGGVQYPITDIDGSKVELMSQSEKDAYVQAYQDYYAAEDQ